MVKNYYETLRINDSKFRFIFIAGAVTDSDESPSFLNVGSIVCFPCFVEYNGKQKRFFVFFTKKEVVYGTSL
jgi:hypothetical protein